MAAGHIDTGVRRHEIVQRSQRHLGKGPKVLSVGEEFIMKATVNEDCIGCGLCESTCDAVFAIGDEGIAEVVVDEVPEESEDAAQEAADNCPVSAIGIE